MADTGRESPTIEELEIFLLLAELRTQDAVSKRLRKPAPYVSRRVAAVRKYFGHQLFEGGHGHDSRLTAQGELVLEHVAEALSLIKSARDTVRSDGPIRVGFSPAVRFLVVKSLVEFGKDVRLLESGATIYREQLRRREIDLAIGYNLAVKTSDKFETRKLLEQPLRLVLPSSEKKGGSVRERIGDKRRCYISRRLQQDSFKDVSAWLRDLKINATPEPAGECQSAGEMFTKIGTGKWFGLLPQLCSFTAGRDIRFDEEIQQIGYRATVFAFHWKESAQRLGPLFDALDKAAVKFNHRPRRGSPA